MVNVLNTALKQLKVLTPSINAIRALKSSQELHEKFLGFTSDSDNLTYVKTVRSHFEVVRELVCNLLLVSEKCNTYYIEFDETTKKAKTITDKPTGGLTLIQTLFNFNIHLSDYFDILNEYQETQEDRSEKDSDKDSDEEEK